jgi:ABC-type phosphate/phosphonate transport system substrate-binding protein
MTAAVNRRQFLHTAAAPALALLPPGLHAQASAEPLTLALAPFLSPAALLQAFRPLREHLEQRLARPVEMLTARDFRALCEATQAQRQDAAMLPAHLARLAAADWGHQPLAATIDSLQVLVLVHRDGTVRSAADLRGAAVGMLDPFALTATVGRLWLQQQGLEGGVRVVALPSINSALFALDRGEVAAIVAGQTQLLSLPPSTPRSERVLATLRDIPGPIYVARAGLPTAEREALRAALLSFAPDPQKPATAANAALHPIDPAVWARLDPLAAIARRALAGS